MFGLGVGEIAVILVIALVFIGPKKLPELARTLGKGFREFQGAMKGINQTFQNPTDFSSTNNPQKNDSSESEIAGRVPWEEQFKDDPPHEQNLSDEDLAYQAAKDASQKKTE